MTIKKLSRNYDALTASERAALCFRAAARQDLTELQRLNDTAPRENWTGPNHSPDLQAISTLSLLNHIEQLGFAQCYWFAIGQSAIGIIREAHGEKVAKIDHDFVAKVSAYRYAMNREAWSRFRAELGIGDVELPADDLVQSLLNLCDEKLPGTAPSREELAVMLQEKEDDEATPITLDDVLAGWRDTFGALTGEGPSSSATD